jgi:hypothetical protein
MLPESHSKLIKNAKEKYEQIGYLKCPAFSNEKVYFNKHGFNHLLRKGKTARSLEQQNRRIVLLDSVKEIIMNASKYSEYKLSNDREPPAQFWSFIKSNSSEFVKVIVRQIGNGNKHFFSVMDRR